MMRAIVWGAALVAMVVGQATIGEAKNVRGRIDGGTPSTYPVGNAVVRLKTTAGIPVAEERTGQDGLYYVKGIEPGLYLVDVGDEPTGLIYVAGEPENQDIPPILVGEVGQSIRTFLESYRAAFVSQNPERVRPFFDNLPDNEFAGLQRFFDFVSGDITLTFANLAIDQHPPAATVTYLQAIDYANIAERDKQPQAVRLNLVRSPTGWKIER